jgi:hypothetical protein
MLTLQVKHPRLKNILGWAISQEDGTTNKKCIR